jgi:hypothetical protein
VLIVRPTIIGVLEVDVLVVRSYANRVGACRISLLNEQTMCPSHAASLEISTSFIVVDTAGLYGCRCGPPLWSINVNVNLNRTVASNCATILKLANQAHASFEKGHNRVSTRGDVHLHFEDPSWAHDACDRDWNAPL